MGSEGVPRLGASCDPDRQRFPFTHAVCGGWWCTCPCHDEPPLVSRELVGVHVLHEWEQVGQAVVCCGRVLYHGTVPTDRAGRIKTAGTLDGLALRAADEWEAMRVVVLAAREPSDG